MVNGGLSTAVVDRQTDRQILKTEGQARFDGHRSHRGKTNAMIIEARRVID